MPMAASTVVSIRARESKVSFLLSSHCRAAKCWSAVCSRMPTAQIKTGVSDSMQMEVWTIANAIEDPETPLRVPVGQDGEMILGARRSLDDQAFEDAMRKAVGFTG